MERMSSKLPLGILRCLRSLLTNVEHDFSPNKRLHRIAKIRLPVSFIVRR